MDEIVYIDRLTNSRKVESVPGGSMLKWLYNKPCGKLTLHALMKRKCISSLGGWYMDRKFSKKRIENFVKQNNIDMTEYEVSDCNNFKTFNDFFTRKIKPENRPIGEGIVSPADGRLLAFNSIADVNSFFIKGSEFSLQSFLADDEVAKKYQDGAMVIIRLAPVDYHRFHFPAEGMVSETKNINGFYYSVSPIALKKSLEIFYQNKRTICNLATKNHGDILISDVGATMVGSIIQTYLKNNVVDKGEEKGYFKFGGSTLVLLFEKGKVKIDQDLIENTKKGCETRILMGEQIAQ